MTAVFIHGVPETWRIWDAIRAELAPLDTRVLALPGFDAPVPEPWDATKEQYAQWIIDQLEPLYAEAGPLDVVGHDWGCLLTQRVVSIRPDLFRSWVCGSGPIDTEYTWHDTAQAWQTPELGEQVMEMMTPELLATALVPELGDHAAPMAQYIDATMRDVILKLYRSAIDVGKEWQPGVEALGATLPALVLWGRDDSYVPPVMGQRLAQRIGAQCIELECGHFWPVLKPTEVAHHLSVFWNTL